MADKPKSFFLENKNTFLLIEFEIMNAYVYSIESSPSLVAKYLQLFGPS